MDFEPAQGGGKPVRALVASLAGVMDSLAAAKVW
jgi:hypothetical protein